MVLSFYSWPRFRITGTGCGDVSSGQCVRGHHIYLDVWSPYLGEVLQCTRELANTKDRYAVSVMHLGSFVGHVPRKIAAACALFLAINGTICCDVTGTRCYSGDLPQGGLEIPCKLTFRGEPKVVRKLKTLLSLKNENGNENEPAPSKTKIDLEKAIDVEKILDIFTTTQHKMYG